MRKAIEVNKKFALFLYFLASTDGYRSLANLFGVSRGFISICIREVANATLRKLRSKYLTIAKGDELRRIIDSYREKYCVLSLGHFAFFKLNCMVSSENMSIRESTSSSFQAKQDSFSCELSPAAVLKSTPFLTPELRGF